MARGSKKKKSREQTGGRPKKKKNDIAIDFNPDARVEFIVGFHRRKTERRKVASKQIEEKERKERLQKRQEKREDILKQISEQRKVKEIGEDFASSKIYFAGEAKNVKDILTFTEQDAQDSSNPTSNNYNVNNQFISVVTQAIDFSSGTTINNDDDHYSDDSEDERYQKLEQEVSQKVAEARKLDEKRQTVPVYQYQATEAIWKPVETRAQPLEARTKLKIITFNIWSSDKQQKQRFAGLINLIRRYNADCVCLQEVNMFAMGLLCSDPTIRDNYIISDVSGKFFDAKVEFGSVVLIHRSVFYALKNVFYFKFENSIGGRAALFVEFRNSVLSGTEQPDSDDSDDDLLVDDSREQNLVIAAVHLEGLTNEATRIQQLKDVVQFFKRHNNVVLVGDFSALTNEMKKHSTILEQSKFKDLWEDFNNLDEEPGWTFDQNVMEHLLSAKQRKKKNKIQARYDRVMFKSKRHVWRPTEIEIVGDAPLLEGVYISNHFAIMAGITNAPSLLTRPSFDEPPSKKRRLE